MFGTSKQRRDELPLIRRNRLGMHEIDEDEREFISDEKANLCELRGLAVNDAVFRTSFVPKLLGVLNPTNSLWRQQ
jgi:hypothetical protein